MLRTASPSLDVVDAFLEVVRRCPDRPAIVHNGQPLTYSQLSARAQAVASHLGPAPGTVAIPATHSPDTIAGLLGVWAAGGTYCPIDPAFPPQRQRAMRDAAGCHTVLTAQPDPAPSSQPPRDLMYAGSAEPAYILFTSGSTAEPKPVAVSRRAIGVTVQSLRDLFGLTTSDRVLQFASLNWDTCFEEILPTLTTGASLVLHSEAHTGSFPRFLRMVQLEQVAVLDLPTAFWHELVNYLLEDGLALPDCVRLVIIGGEPVSPARLADWCTLDVPRTRLLNTYGCTETTLITHAVDLREPWGKVPIGRPLPHVTEHITDEGELLIGGPALADGYRGLHEATDARFITLHSGRFFRTGDRVSRLPDGMLVHEGRLDHELKIRGIRVDPAEVEAQIARHPAVSAVAVVGVTIADHTALVAYVVPRPLAAGTGLGTEILDHLRPLMPSHLIPSRISIVDELIYTASGKVDRRRIKEAFQ